MQRKSSEHEFSRPLPVDKITTSGVEQEVEAKSNERLKLAERFGLIEVKELRATLRAELIEGGRTVAVTGTMLAEVVQRCVVSLDPIPASLEQDIDTHFAVYPLPASDSAVISDPDLDDIEAVENGTIDLGELAAQTMGIALDPYPRKPNIPYVRAISADPSAENTVVEGPFAKLAELKEATTKKKYKTDGEPK
ncbi:MAG: YceD family protein [Bdellovibrionales bacterium]